MHYFYFVFFATKIKINFLYFHQLENKWTNDICNRDEGQLLGIVEIKYINSINFHNVSVTIQKYFIVSIQTSSSFRQ